MALGTEDLARSKPHQTALFDPYGELSWGEIDDILNRAANGLAARNLGPDRRVAVFAENSSEVVLAHLGAILAGASSVPVSFHLTASECAWILADSAARLLFVGPETAERGVRAAAEHGVDVDLVVGWRTEPRDGIIPWAEWLADAPAHRPDTDDLPPRPHLHYTSGTTGFPKGVGTPPAMWLGGDTLAEQVELIRRSPILSSGRLGLVIAPLYHTGPLSGVRGLLGGNRSVILGRFHPEKVLGAIDRHRIESVFMVPTHFQRLLALPAGTRHRYDFSSLRLVSHTGAACPVDVKRAMIDWVGPILMEAYGATEAGTTNMILSDEWLEHPGSVGRTLPGFELVVTDDDGNLLGPNEVGRLYFRDLSGRGVVYHNDPAATAEAHLVPGVFTMGEIGYFDDDGYVYITDRAKDMVVSGGVNLDPGDPPQSAELIAFCRDRLASLKCPRTVDFVADLGRNAMGKVNKRQLRVPYWPTGRTIG